MKDEKRDKAEREAAELKEKLAMKERVAQNVCDDIVQEGVDEEIKDVAREQHRLVNQVSISFALCLHGEIDQIICECLSKYFVKDFWNRMTTKRKLIDCA